MPLLRREQGAGHCVPAVFSRFGPRTAPHGLCARRSGRRIRIAGTALIVMAVNAVARNFNATSSLQLRVNSGRTTVWPVASSEPARSWADLHVRCCASTPYKMHDQ